MTKKRKDRCAIRGATIDGRWFMELESFVLYLYWIKETQPIVSVQGLIDVFKPLEDSDDN